MKIEPVSDVRLNPSPLVEAFLFEFGKVARAYEYDWSKQESFAERAAWLKDGGYKGDRRAVAAALERYNRALGAGEATLANIGRLAEEGTLVVVTGQQPGVFSGPAYSIYKAMTAIRLARLQSEQLSVPVVPVFWVAGEDHDWQEISWVLAPAGDGMTKVQLKESFDGDRRSVGLAPMPASLPEVMEEFFALLPETEFKAEVVERVKAAAEGNLADWFARLMTWIFEGSGLIILNPSLPALRQLEAGFFAAAIDRHEQVDEALGKGHDLLDEMGYRPTVDRQLGNLNLFTYLNGERLPLVGAGEHFWIRDREELGWSKEELIDRAMTHPELFSTNVVLRPVVQGRLLPDLAMVCGPGEISYFGLYKDVFRTLDGQMPVVYPRESFSLVEPPLARILEKQELTLGDLFFRLDEKKQEMLEREDRLGITDLFETFRSELGERYEGLTEKLLELDPQLRFVIDENRKQIAVQVNKLEEKARQQHRKNLEVTIRQFDRLKGNFMPAGLQERAVSILPYMAKYGPDLVARLLTEAEMKPGEWVHRAVYLGT